MLQSETHREPLKGRSQIKLEVNVKYFATLREITDKREEKVKLQEGSTVEDLLKQLVGQYGTRFREYVVDEETGKPRAHLLFLINGTSISSLEGLSTKLSHDSVVALMPPVGGG